VVVIPLFKKEELIKRANDHRALDALKGKKRIAFSKKNWVLKINQV